MQQSNMRPQSGLRSRRHPRLRGSLILALLVAVLAGGGIPTPAASQAGAPLGGWGGVEGIVTDHETGGPVSGAVVSLPAFDATAVSDARGRFAFDRTFPTERPHRRIEASVRASGFGTWTITGVPLYPDDTLRLNAELRRSDWSHRVLTPEERDAPARPPAAQHPHTCTGWKMQLVPPKNIKVFRSETQVSEEHDFLFYATHVLPNEWIPSWDSDALAAGAIAVKTYAAYRTMPNNAYSGGEDCADVIDTVADQVFDPTWSTLQTDQAVYEGWGSILWRGNGWFLAQYYAGLKGEPCAPVTGTFEGRMSQWGTQSCALDGMVWPDIVSLYYEDTRWHYLHNLLLNPAVENNVIYPWLLTPEGALKRFKGGAYEGSYYYQLSTTAPPTAGITYQMTPYLGKPETAYRVSLALKCNPENGQRCIIKLRIIAHAEDGSTRLKQKKIRMANDGQWRFYTFLPPAPGVDHEFVETQILSVQTIGFDMTELRVISP